MNILPSLLGAVPALAAMAWVDRLDAARPEPRVLLHRMALAGGLATIPCVLVQLLLIAAGPSSPGFAKALWIGFVVAAATEEFAKLLCIRWLVWHRPELDERMDGIVYAARAGLGFALVENVLYLLGTKGLGAFLGVFVARALLAVPAHAICAGMMGYLAARRRFDGTGPGLAGGYVLAVLLHGSYDAALFLFVFCGRERPLLFLPVLLVPLLVVVGGGIVLHFMARTALTLDDADHRLRA